MYAFFQGTIEDISTDRVVILCGGVGYELLASGLTIASLKKGQTARLHAHLSVREDALVLYGFTSFEEKCMFGRLIGVSGVGPRLAIALLSALTPTELAIALVTGDAAALSRAPGVGRKLAQRLVLELKEKVDTSELAAGGADAAICMPSAAQDAIQALIALGYNSADAARAIDSVKGQAEKVEQLVLLALKKLDS